MSLVMAVLMVLTLLPDQSLVAKADSPNYFYIEAAYSEAVTMTISDSKKNLSGLQYSTNNGSTWSDVSYSSENWTLTVPSGKKYLLKRTGSCGIYSSTYGTVAYPSYSGQFNVGGDITSLLNGTGGVTDLSSYGADTFYGMFKKATCLKDASNLVLPSTKLSADAYAHMFYGCTSLTAAPALPATDLNASCYFDMFYGCTSLTTAPDLPATKMFEACYRGMFYGCTGLTTAPEICATTLAEDCMVNMFRGCSNLSSITVKFTNWDNGAYTNYWVDGVAASGTFNCPADLDTSKTGVNYIPSNWTVKKSAKMFYIENADTSDINVTVTNVANFTSLDYSVDNGATWTAATASGGSFTYSLPASAKILFKGSATRIGTWVEGQYVTFSADGLHNVGGDITTLLDENGYVDALSTNYEFTNLFDGDTKLVDASALSLPSTTVGDSSYYRMFHGCTSLTKAPELPATTLGRDCYMGMFQGCTSLTKAPELPATELANYCYTDMFDGCTSLSEAPSLPALSLKTCCYAEMFKNCTSLTKAPYLPALTLETTCYEQMFNGCSNLSSITVGFTDWSDTYTQPTDQWCDGVAASGTFTCPWSLDTTQSGASYIPEGWTVNAVESLYVENLDESNTIGVNIFQSSSDVRFDAIYYSKDEGKTWTEAEYYDYDSTKKAILSAPAGGKLYLRAFAPNGISIAGSLGDCYILAAGNHSVGGDVTSLLNGLGGVEDLTEYGEGGTLGGLFYRNSWLVDASDLILPSTTLSIYAYEGMFKDCTNLEKAPKLPATTLSQSCYLSMFSGCSSLTKSPRLPATTLVGGCYETMFRDCTSLKSVTADFTDWGESDLGSTSGWLYNVSETGHFYYADGLNVGVTRSSDTIPVGWNVSPIHTHNFSDYSASGSTISLTCDNADGNCYLSTDEKTGKHVLTLSISCESKLYDESAVEAVLSGTDEWEEEELTVPTIYYAGREDTTYASSATAPSAAGQYTASITVNGVTAKADFTIYEKAEVTGITVKEGINTVGISEDGDPVTAGDLYTGTPRVGDETAKSVTFKWHYIQGVHVKDLDSAPSEIGIYKLVVCVTGTKKQGSVSIPFKIYMSEDKISLGSSGTVYDGGPVTVGLTDSSLPEGYGGTLGSVVYYTDSDCTVKTTAENSGAEAEGKAPVYAGTYYAKAVVTVTGGYASSEGVDTTVKKSFTIAKDSSSFKTEAEAYTDLTYTGSAQTLVKTAATTSDGAIKYSLEENGTYDTAFPKGTDAGDYTVYYKIIGDNNHNDSDPKTVTATIKKAAYTGTKTATGKILAGFAASDIEVTLPSVPDNMTYGTPSYSSPVTAASVSDGKLKFSGNDTAVKDNEYTVKIPVTEISGKSANYSDYEITVTLTGFECTHATKTPVSKVDATCTTDGKQAYDKCDVCGLKFVGDDIVNDDDLVIEKLGHSFTYTVNSNAVTASCVRKDACKLADMTLTMKSGESTFRNTADGLIAISENSLFGEGELSAWNEAGHPAIRFTYYTDDELTEKTSAGSGASVLGGKPNRQGKYYVEISFTEKNADGTDGETKTIGNTIVNLEIGGTQNPKWVYKDGKLKIEETETIPDYDTDEENYAPWYGYRDEITEVELDDTLKVIGSDAFADLSGITELIVPASVTKINKGAYAGCSKLAYIKFEGDCPTISEQAFVYGTDSVASVGTARVPHDWTEEQISYLDSILPVAWTVISFEHPVTVTFDLNGGSFISSSYKLNPVTYERGSLISSPSFSARSLCRNTLIFQDWFLDADCTEIWDFDVDAIYEDMTLYAGYAYDAGGDKNDLPDMTISAVPDYTYTGSAIKPVVTVKYGSEVLTEITDYTVSYKKNVNANPVDSEGNVVRGGINSNFDASLPTIVIKGKGKYQSSVSMNFVILPADLTDADSNLVTDISECIQANAKKDSKVTCSLVLNNKKLAEGKDYTLALYKADETGAPTGKAYDKCTVPKGETGDYVLVVNGIGNFTGTLKKAVKVTDTANYLPTATVKMKKVTYEGTALTAADIKTCISSVKLNGKNLKADQYDVELASDITATGVYTLTIISKDASIVGTKDVEFMVYGVDISKAKVTVKSAVYDNTNHGTNGMVVTAKVGKTNTTLVEDVDYTATVSNDRKAGTATVVLKGIGNCSGEKTVTYRIDKFDLANATVNMTDSSVIATGSAFNVKAIEDQARDSEPEVVITGFGRKLVNGTDYTLTYTKNNKLGTATITVVGIGNFKGKLKGITYNVVKTEFEDAGIFVIANDVVYNAKSSKNYKSKSVKLYNASLKALKQNSDYSKDMKYYLYTGTFDGYDSESVKAHLGTEITGTEEMPVGTRIIVEISEGTGGVFSGKVYGTYRIVSKDIKSANIKVKDQSYTGGANELNASDFTKATLGKAALTYGTDFEIIDGTYSNNTKIASGKKNSGAASVMIRGLGEYGGTKTIKFRVVKKTLSWYNRMLY